MPTLAHCCKPPLRILNSHYVHRFVLCDKGDAEAASEVYFVNRELETLTEYNCRMG